MSIQKIHFITGTVLTLFIGAHLMNHLYSFYGPQQHIDMMNALRMVYRNVVVETLLLLCVALQIFTGFRLWRSYQINKNLFEKIQILSGLYLAFFLLIHVGAVLTGRSMLKLDTNFYFGIAGLNSFPVNLFFVPYYFLAIVSFFGHIAGIHHKKMKKNVMGFSVSSQSYVILAIGILTSLTLIFFLTNQFNGFEIPKEYHVLLFK